MATVKLVKALVLSNSGKSLKRERQKLLHQIHELFRKLIKQ